MPEPQAPSDPSRVCLSCGLCCNGMLFWRAKAYAGEREVLERLGMTIEESEGRDYFRLPCRHLQGTACSIYEDRFTTCRTFRCRVLRELESGGIDLDEALRRVAVAHDLVSRLEEADPKLTDSEARQRRLREGLTPGDAEGSRAFVAALALDHFLDRHFRNKRRYSDGDGDE